ncbi:hypothetical protein P3T36_004884 [Kitasatospora sp. MAP12-15]|nr:hypothetical protein [Kitasatospora sp. MAP12-44]
MKTTVQPKIPPIIKNPAKAVGKSVLHILLGKAGA